MGNSTPNACSNWLCSYQLSYFLVLNLLWFLNKPLVFINLAKLLPKFLYSQVLGNSPHYFSSILASVRIQILQHTADYLPTVFARHFYVAGINQQAFSARASTVSKKVCHPDVRYLVQCRRLAPHFIFCLVILRAKAVARGREVSDIMQCWSNFGDRWRPRRVFCLARCRQAWPTTALLLSTARSTPLPSRYWLIH